MPDLSDLWLNTIQPMLAQYGLKVVGALVVFVLGFFVARAFRGSTRKGLARSRMDPMLIPFVSGLVYFGLLAFVALAALHIVGISVTPLVAVVGAAGLAIALAFQGTLSNLASGVMLLTFRPFAVGDFVEVGGTSGTVKEVGVFASTLTTPDNVKVIVPNSQIYGETIKNFSGHPTRRIDLEVGVGYDDDLNVAIETIQAVLSAEDRVLADPEPQIAVSEMAGSSVNLVVRPWVNGADYWATRFALTKALKERIEAAGLNIPYPQRDVHLFREDGDAA